MNDIPKEHDSKLERNAISLRHYWNSHTNECECGCKIKIYFGGKGTCLWKLNEILKLDGYKVVRIQK